MMNSTIKILDNTGCYFYSENDHLVIGYALAGYSAITRQHINLTIPYFCKNKSKYEVGLGRIETVEDRLILTRLSILSSSNNNQPVTFESDPGNCLYSFANSYSFNTGFNNLIHKNGDFDVDNTRATYLVDLSLSSSKANLPSAKNNRSLVVEFKTTNGSNNLTISQDGDTLFAVEPNSYLKLISTGLNWLELCHVNQGTFAASSAADTFSAMNTTGAGASGSVQYNDGSFLAGSDIYFSNNRLLFGSISETLAQNIIPTSTGINTVFNNTKSSADFIVRGNGDKNLFFGYDGKLGINIPSGSRPQTSLHIINNACHEAIRLENRNQCYPANLTLYHKPSVVPANNSVVASINLSSKNSANNQVDMVQLRGRALSTTSTATSGELAFAVDKAGVAVEAMVVNADKTTISATNNNRLQVSSSGIYLNGSVNLSSLKWSGSAVSGLFLMSDGNGNIVLTNANSSPIIDLLEPAVVVFTGVCT